MTTAYTQHAAAYDHHVLPPYQPALSSHARGHMPAVGEPLRSTQAARNMPVQQQQPQPQQFHSQALPQLGQQQMPAQQPYTAYPTVLPRADPSSAASQLSTISRHSTRTSTPQNGDTSSSRQGSQSQALVHHSLQIPSCINPKGGNLADFAAQITCFFWFESMDTLRTAEAIRTKIPTSSVQRLTKDSTPHSPFKKWAYQILSTTQVTQSVILLALLFIYRLKTTNPSVKGRAGSEYRLLTVALMLGNKFLDDNTYTNKTWAEVSGITVQEIHVMEVEFLSNMRYSLLATKTEWEQWLVKLACFSEYYERAMAQPPSPITLSSPANHALSSPLPSPTANPQAATMLAPLNSMYSPSSSIPSQQPQNWQPSYSNAGLPATSPLIAKSHANAHAPQRKRASEEEDLADHPAKRVSRQPTSNIPPSRPPVVGEQPIRLPVPNLSVNTANNTPSQNPTSYAAAPAGVQYNPPTSNQVSLPPLVAGSRAMASVYPATSVPQPNPQLPMPAATSSAAVAPVLTPTNGLPTHGMHYGTPSRRQSPGTLGHVGSSPMGDPYASATASAIHTPMLQSTMKHSPSIYLQQRQSPYKPVRHFNTLLYPPPSASLNEYHMSVPTTQMHYYPLGRRNDLRTGVVPDYMGMPYRNMPPLQLPTQGPPHGLGGNVPQGHQNFNP